MDIRNERELYITSLNNCKKTTINKKNSIHSTNDLSEMLKTAQNFKKELNSQRKEIENILYKTNETKNMIELFSKRAFLNVNKKYKKNQKLTNFGLKQRKEFYLPLI